MARQPCFQPTVVAPEPGDVEAGLRGYFLSVYNHLADALILAGVVDYAAAESGHYRRVVGVAFYWTVFFPRWLWAHFLASDLKVSVDAARLTFWSYAALVGLSLFGLFVVYTSASIAQVFFITAATFGAMSLHGYTTQRDLSRIGSFLFVGLIGVVIASVVNMFFASAAFQFAISLIGVVIFAGLTTWYTQRYNGIPAASDDGSVSEKETSRELCCSISIFRISSNCWCSYLAAGEDNRSCNL